MLPMGDFSYEVQTLLNMAITENRKLKHPYVGSEHFILALLSLEDSFLTNFLNTKNINYQNFYNKLVELLGVGQNFSKEKLFTPLFKRILINAALQNNGHEASKITPLDIFLSLLEEGDGMAIRMLIELVGLDTIEELHEDLVNFSKNETNDFSNFILDKRSSKNKNDINKEGEIYMNYIYDFYGGFKDEKEINIKRAPLFNINKETFNRLLSKVVILDSDFFESIANKCQVFDKNQIKNMTICAFSCQNEHSTIIIKFSNKGISLKGCFLEKEVSEEAQEIAARMKLLDGKEIKEKSEPGILFTSMMEIMLERKISVIENLNNNNLEEKSKAINSKISQYNCLINLNEKVKENGTVVVGLDEEIETLIKSLLRIKKPNAIITGEPGVGKTALVEKFACLINEGKVPSIFKDKKIVQLNMSSAVAGTKYRGEFEERLNNIIQFLTKNRDIILFIDEFHTVIGTGGSEGAIDAANILKPALARGEIKVIGATTNNEYDEFIKKDGAFARRFNRVTVLEPTKEQVISILNGVRPSIENTYGIIISDKMIEQVYEEAKYKEGRMPDIALDALEDLCINRYFEIEKEKVK